MSSPIHHAKDELDAALIYAPPWAREQALKSGGSRALPSPHVADNHAYNAAIECAALCLFALESPTREPFRQHMREMLRQALYLRGAFPDGEPFVDGLAAREVLNDVVACASGLLSGDLLSPANVLGRDADVAWRASSAERGGESAFSSGTSQPKAFSAHMRG
jgi:hypothetical protein